MENIDINFTIPNDNNSNSNNTSYKRNYVLQKYVTALRQFRQLAEEEYQVRPYNFDNFIRYNYYEKTSSSDGTDNAEKDDISNDKKMNRKKDGVQSSDRRRREHLFSALLKIELLKLLRDRRRQILYWLVSFLLALLCFFVYRDEAAISSRTVHIYNMVYPSMRMWRRITLPLIQRFPSLTELYDESCLMENPFFQAVDLSCEACANVESILDLSDSDVDKNIDDILMKFGKGMSEVDTLHIYGRRQLPKNSNHVPFLFRINQSHIDVNDFYNIYAKHRDIFRRDAYRVHSTHNDITNLDELFQHFVQSETRAEHARDRSVSHINTNIDQTHNLWRCNRMLPARLLRPFFAPRLTNRLPTAGLALERFLAIDAIQAPTYTLPDTECANVYIEQLQGSRFIIMRPTSECRHRCRTLSIRLPQSFVLSYNWWYWRPISTPDPAADTMSISLIGSYC